jgi:ribonuclease HI
MQVTIHVDGGSRGNPGPAAAGVVITDTDRDVVVHEAGYFLGRMTNNAAEYHALIRALEMASTLGASDSRIVSDSELVVKQVTGEYRVKSADLKPLYEQVQRLLMRLGLWQIRHVKREQNTRADQLANMALDAESDCIVVNGEAGEEDAVPSARPAPAPAAAKPAARPADPAVRWSATIVGDDAATCALGCATDQAFTFGPGTPPGFCVQAAKAVFAATPSNDPARMRTLRRIETACPQCGLVVRIDIDRS